MLKLGIYAPLTKKYVLERLTEEEIMERYTKISVNSFTLTGNSFTSPLRKDNHPTCNYYYNQNNKLRLKDWDGSFDGDIFDIVGLLGAEKPINARTSQGFNLILNIIAEEFRIHKYKDGKERVAFKAYIEKYNKNITPKVMKVIPRSFNMIDKRYWLYRYGIDSDLLKIGKVFPAEEVHIEGKDGFLHRVYKYKSSDPAYAYLGGKEDGILIWKIYFPLRKKSVMTRFMTNKAFVQGMNLIQPAKVGIITKSYKDVLCLKTFNLNSISVAAEGIIPSKDTLFKFKRNFNITISLMDSDRTGILMANKLKHQEGIQPIMFTQGRFNQPNYGAKDFSDFVHIYGREKTNNLLHYIIEQHQEDLDKLDLYNYNSLKNIK